MRRDERRSVAMRVFNKGPGTSMTEKQKRPMKAMMRYWAS